MRHHTAKRPQSVEPGARRTRMEELLDKIRRERREIENLMELERSTNGKAAQIDNR